MSTFAAVRVQKFASMATIRAAEAHGRRIDDAAVKRVDTARTGLNLAASRYSPDDPLALEAAYRAFRKQTGAVEGKGAAVMAHAIVIISPEVLAESGDPRNPDNPKVRALFDQAQAWARSEFGDDALVAARMDMDEAGAGVVDLYLTPTAMQAGGRGRKPKLTISVKSALEGISGREQERQGLDKPPRSYSALQDSWGRWAGLTVDPRLKRGRAKRETMRQHVYADVFREDAEALKARAKALDVREAELTAREQEAQARIERIEDSISGTRGFIQAFRDRTVSRVIPNPEIPGGLMFMFPKSLSGETKEQLRKHWRSMPPALQQTFAMITETRKTAVEAARREGLEQSRKESVAAFSGLLGAWADNEIRLHPEERGEWLPVGSLERDRGAVLAGWIRLVGRAVERIVVALSERMGVYADNLTERKAAVKAVEIEDDDYDWDDGPKM